MVPPAVELPSDVPTPAPAERLALVDTLRGFALLGVCVVNFTQFGHPLMANALGGRPRNGPWDAWVEHALYLLAEGKFYAIFSLLFGLGLFLQVQRSEGQGYPVGTRFARRLGVLAGLGLMHGVLVWSGDVLLCYALIGFALLLFKDVSVRWLRRWAVLSTLGALALLWGSAALLELLQLLPEAASELQKGLAASEAKVEQELAAAYAAYGQGSYLEALRFRVREWPMFLISGLFTSWPLILSMFLVGLCLGRTGVLHRPVEHLRFLRRAGLGCAVLGLLACAGATLLKGRVNLVLPSFGMAAQTSLHLIGGLVLGFAYLCGFTLLMQREAWQRRLAPLATVGRMSLSNYLGQSLVGVCVFYGYGLGLFGRTGAGVGVLLGLGVFALQVLLSRWWLARYRLGPAEWLWRSLSLGAAQPLRRTPPAPGAAPSGG